MADGQVTGYVAGVDLGTTYSAAAVAPLGTAGRADIVTLGHTSAVLPSMVLVRADGEVLVGEAAERRGVSEPTRLGREFKRRLGDPVPLVLGGTPYGAEALSALLLRHVVGEVAAQQGAPPATVVVTHPANYGGYKLDLLREAVRVAALDGVDDVRFLSEPEAAATHYAQQERLDPGDVVAVYDFGGGTFDAAVVRVGEAGFELIGTPEGMERLGGIDFDQAVFTHVVNALGEAVVALDPTDPGVESGLARLRESCRVAKEALSSDTDADVPVALPTLHTEVRVTRHEFEAMIRPRIAETIESLHRAVRSAGLDWEQVTKVLLVGGSSRIPLVAEMVRSVTGRPVAIDAHPKHAIAVGAALHARSGSVGVAPPISTLPPPPLGASPGGPANPADAVDAVDAVDAADADGSTGSPRRRLLVIVAAIVLGVIVAAGAYALLGGDPEVAAPASTSSPITTVAAADTAPGDADADADADAESGDEVGDVAGDDGAGDDGDDAIVTAGEVILVAFDDTGDDPFTESVADEPNADLLAFVRRGGATLVEEQPSDPGGATTLVSRLGTDPGVYGGTRDERVCDSDQLVQVLGERPDEADAWAGVHEIEVDEIGEFVGGLTALVLTSDVRVTNHGFRDGVALERQTVLQVGTAVLVDDEGVPRVRCSSGSPLLPPEPVVGTTRYTGPAWESFSPATTAAIAPSPVAIDQFVVFDVGTGSEFVRPVGSTGLADRPLLPGEIRATGGVTSIPEYSGSFLVNEFELIFRPEGGPVEGTFTYRIVADGLEIGVAGDLIGTYDPSTRTIDGTISGSVEADGISVAVGDSPWTGTVDPAAGTIVGRSPGDGGDAVFELTFPPFEPVD